MTNWVAGIPRTIVAVSDGAGDRRPYRRLALRTLVVVETLALIAGVMLVRAALGL